MQATVGQEEPSRGRRGIVFVLSAPSGAGKTSLSKRIVVEMPGVVPVVTCTTRAPRPGEQDGREYHFLSRRAFERCIAAGDFLEWAQFNGQLYGNLRQSVEAVTAAGQWDALAERLRARGSESASTQAQRLLVARQELAHYTAYDYVVINDQLDDVVETLQAIIVAERHRIRRVGTVPIAPLLAPQQKEG